MSTELATNAQSALRRRIFLALVSLLGLMVVLGVYRFYGTRIYINEGRVCFQPPLPASDHIRFSIGGVGCFSSSCTEVFLRRGNLKVELEKPALRLTSILVGGPLRLLHKCPGGLGRAGRWAAELRRSFRSTS